MPYKVAQHGTEATYGQINQYKGNTTGLRPGYTSSLRYVNNTLKSSLLFCNLENLNTSNTRGVTNPGVQKCHTSENYAVLSAEAGEESKPIDCLKTEQNAPQHCSADEPLPKVES